MIWLIAIWLFSTLMSAMLSALLVQWIWPHWSEGRLACAAAATLPVLMVGIGVSLLLRDWNADSGGREAHTIGFDIGRLLVLASMATFLVGATAAKPFVRSLRRK